MIRLAALALVFGWMYTLVADWYENGHHYCRYSDGEVLMFDARLCPLSIQR